MNTKSILFSVLLLAITSILSGCGSSPTVTTTHERSVGEQLADLSEAHQQGIINDKEFAKLKEALIKKND